MTLYSKNKDYQNATHIRKKIRTVDILARKKNGQLISCLTCYDSTFARILESTNVDVVLVGDSLGQVMQGADSTLTVSIQDVAYHVRCVHSNLKTPLLVADMPFTSACLSPAETMKNAALLMQAGAEAVKIEGATGIICDHIQFLTAHGIPVMGHIGLMPQSVHAVGGYRVQGKGLENQERLCREALRLQESGCFSVVLELVDPLAAEAVTKLIQIPTIGIGCGNVCDGNILVLQDMLGLNAQFKPKFLKHFAQLENLVKEAVNGYCSAVCDRTSETKVHE